MNADAVRETNTSTRMWAMAIIVTTLFCTMQIRRSLVVGELSLPPTYDGSSYYLSAAELLWTFFDGGVVELARSYLDNPPHAPLSTFLALLGFSLFGINSWAGAAANTGVLVLFVRAFLAFAAPVGAVRAGLLAVAFLGFPFLRLTLLDFRPDMFCSLLLASGTLYVVLRPEWLTQTRDQLISGAILAAALWAKSSVFHLSIALYCAAIGLVSVRPLLQRQWAVPIKATCVTLSLAVILSLPYYYFTFRRTIQYIWNVVFGIEASIWVKPMPLLDHALFYLSGQYGEISIGKWLFVAPVLGLASLWLIWRRERARFEPALRAAGMVLITYLAVTIPAFKGPHGFPFAATFMLAGALASAQVVKRLHPLLGWGVCASLLLFSAAQFDWPTRVAGRDYVDSRWSIVRQAVEAVGTDSVGKTLLLTTSSVHLNYNILALEFYRAGLRPPLSDNVQTLTDFAEIRRRIDSADIVFALSPEFTAVYSHLPTASPEARARILKLIEDNGRFRIKREIVDSHAQGSAYIFVRAAPNFGTFGQVSGLREEEGPYPQWQLPRVRWGWGTETKLVARAEPGSKARLLVDARSVALTDQTLSISVNGNRQAPVQITDAFLRIDAEVAFGPDGKAEIVLHYGVPAQNAVLYKTLTLDMEVDDEGDGEGGEGGGGRAD